MQDLFLDYQHGLSLRVYGKNAHEAIQLYKNIKEIEETGAWELN